MDIIYKANEILPPEIMNNIYSFLGPHPTAILIKEDKIIDEYFERLFDEYLDVYMAFMFGAM